MRRDIKGGRRRGMGGHHATVGASDEWYTPPSIFAALGLAFDLDPCAPPAGEASWLPVARRYSLPDDGLVLPWEGRVFLNPPYGPATGVWVRRLAAHGNGVALVFARTDTTWFHDVAQSADGPVLHPPAPHVPAGQQRRRRSKPVQRQRRRTQPPARLWRGVRGCGGRERPRDDVRRRRRRGARADVAVGDTRMSRIVVVRIVGADCSRAMEQFVRVFKPVNLTLDTNPGSAAPGGVAGTESEITVGHPEFEITVEGHPEARVVDVLRAVGVSVLASREQVGAGIVLPMDMIPVARARMSNIQPAEQMPSFGDIRFDAYGMLGDVEDLLRSDWAAGTGPTHAQAEATRDARSLIARAKEALNRAAD